MLGAPVPVHEITKLLTKRDEISLEALGTEKNSWYEKWKNEKFCAIRKAIGKAIGKLGFL